MEDIQKVLDDLDKKIIPESYSFLNVRMNCIREESSIDMRKDSSKETLKEMLNLTYSRSFIKEMELLGKRGQFIDKQGFALVSKSWIRPLADYLRGKKVIEVMAGLGTITYALREEGIDIVATDIGEWGKFCDVKKDTWVEVEEYSAQSAIRDFYETDYVICSWPPYRSNALYDLLMAMRKYLPNAKLIYIGEGYMGCCGCDKFFKSAQFINDEDIESIAKEYISWYGINDSIYLVK